MSIANVRGRLVVPSLFLVVVLMSATALSVLVKDGLEPIRLPRYSLPQETEAGKQTYHAIQTAAKSEGLLDRFWKRDCHSRAIRELDNRCHDLAPSQKSRLAFSLTRCQLLIQGEPDEPRLRCPSSTMLKTCLNGLSSREYAIYVELLSSIDVACLWIQNVNFEATAETVLNDLVRYGVENSALVSKLGQELDTMYRSILRHNMNATAAAAAFATQLNAINLMHVEIRDAAADIRELFKTIKSDTKGIENFHKSIKKDITALVELQQSTTRTLQGLAADIPWPDTAFYAAGVLLLVLSTSIGVPAKPRALYFCWIMSVLALERAFHMSGPSKVLLRKGIGVVVVLGWFCAEWVLRSKRVHDKAVTDRFERREVHWKRNLAPPKTEQPSLRRSPRRATKRAGFKA